MGFIRKNRLKLATLVGGIGLYFAERGLDVSGVENTPLAYALWALGSLLIIVSLVLFGWAWLNRGVRKRQEDSGATTSRRTPQNMGAQMFVSEVNRFDKKEDAWVVQLLRCTPGTPEGTLPLMIDIEELVGSPQETSREWTLQVQNVVLFTRDDKPITCRVYLTGDCGSYRESAEEIFDYVLGSPITVTNETQHGTFVFHMRERLLGSGPINSANRLWRDLELAFLEVGTDRSLYIPFAVTQSIPDTEDSSSPRAE